MNEPLVSIVVPVYNGEKYLEETLNILKNQTYKNFEVIMVDDISTDNSVQILEKFANEDERFKLIKRKTWISVAGNCLHGIYIVFAATYIVLELQVT